MKYEVILESFEGPLDLLLKLIGKAQVDIYDIPINMITNQYMEHIYTMEDLNLDVASEFILMAASLIEIKSKMLLPKNILQDEEEEDPREELVLRLLEYKKYKDAAERLREKELHEIKAYYKPMEDLSIYEEEQEEFDLGGLDLDLLVKSVKNIIEERGLEETEISYSEIYKDEYSVKECCANIVDRLDGTRRIYFTDLFLGRVSKNKIVTYFLSILELTKLKIIAISQNEDFSDIIIEKMD